MSERDLWDGRPVTFVEFSIRDGKPVNAAFAESAEQGSYMLLVLSMQWADTGTPVFAGIDEIEALPFRLRTALVRLSNKAAITNGMGLDDDDALVRKPANGHDTGEVAGPFLLKPERVFLHRLALALHKTVGEIEARMSKRELFHWQLFDAVHEPLPDRLADIHCGMVLATMVNLQLAANSTPVSASDFYVIRDRPPAPAEPEVPEIDRLRAQWRGE